MVKRFDNIDKSEWMTEPFVTTEEGYLKGRAIVTSIGVFPYLTADGKTIQYELRLPDEVFSQETLDSIKMKPVTLNHPDVPVTAENAKDLQVGSLGDNPTNRWFDGINCSVDMIVTDKDAIEAVRSGKRALSMGYTCDIEKAPENAVWCGMKYDFIQRNIRYNHCAIVGTARAGDNAKIDLRIDSGDAVLWNNKNMEDKMLKKFMLDGIEYEAEETVIKKLNAETERADSMIKEIDELKKDNAEKLSKLEAERDTANEKIDALEKEIESLKANQLDQSKIDEAVKEKLDLLRVAEKCKVDVKSDEAEVEIKKKIILSAYPKANFDGKDETYINARFDAVIEGLEEKNDAKNSELFNTENQNKNDSVDDARERMLKQLKKED